MDVYTSDLLIRKCNANPTEANKSIASYLLSVYMQSINFYENDLISCFEEYLKTGCLNLREYNIKF